MPELPRSSVKNNYDVSMKIDQLMQMIQANNDSQERIHQKLDLMTSRLCSLEANQREIETHIQQMENSHINMQTRVDCLSQNQEVFKNDAQILLQELQESQNRLHKNCNILVMGISEEEDDNTIIADLLSILLPNYDRNFIHHRLGQNKVKEKNRPIKIKLASSVDKSTALNNCNKLRNIDRFSKISVRPDLTKKQIEIRQTKLKSKDKSTSANTSSQVTTRAISRKRGLDIDTNAAGSSKILRSKANTTNLMETT